VFYRLEGKARKGLYLLQGLDDSLQNCLVDELESI